MFGFWTEKFSSISPKYISSLHQESGSSEYSLNWDFYVEKNGERGLIYADTKEIR